jgi:flavin reductase (DIM6/NTAB) family NADH-FMN oxidoreductase RutF
VVYVELAGRARDAVYHLLTQVIVPRPIAWVLTVDGSSADGDRDATRTFNLAPYSFFNAVSAAPPLVAVSVGRSPRAGAEVKDTYANLLEHGEHTIMLPHVGQLDAVELTSDALPPGESELAHAGLDLVDWDWATPRIEGVRVALGCTLERDVELSEGGSHLLLCRVHAVWVDDAVVDTDERGRVRVDMSGLDPLARLGAGAYGSLDTPLRPSDRPDLPDR